MADAVGYDLHYHHFYTKKDDTFGMSSIKHFLQSYYPTTPGRSIKRFFKKYFNTKRDDTFGMSSIKHFLQTYFPTIPSKEESSVERFVRKYLPKF